MKATETLETIVAHAETIDQSGDHTPIMAVMDEWRQGDVRIIRLADDFVDTHMDGLCAIEPKQQLAPGTTLGSRHMLDSLDGVEMFALKNATTLDGPVIRTTEPRSITHPEHGNVCDLPAGNYAFPGQRVFAEELRRVSD